METFHGGTFGSGRLFCSATCPRHTRIYRMPAVHESYSNWNLGNFYAVPIGNEKKCYTVIYIFLNKCEILNSNRICFSTLISFFKRIIKWHLSCTYISLFWENLASLIKTDLFLAVCSYKGLQKLQYLFF